jgi:NitT/TauT family transport system ATP-binding protein
MTSKSTEKQPERDRAVALTVRGVEKAYRTEAGRATVALRDVNVVVHEGEFVVLLGPSGCGKTTLLNVVAGLDVPDRGEVRLAEGLRPGANMPCVFQHYTLFPWRTILRNVTFGLEMRGVPRRQRRETARALLAKVGLEGVEFAYPHELSGGMRQRAAIAQALAIRPGMLLMDEPFGALDDSNRNELQRMLIDLWEERRFTVLFVTHNIDEAIRLADRVVVFSEPPGHVRREFSVPLPRPRDRLSTAFTGLFMQIRESLVAGNAVAGSGGGPN